MPISTAWFSPSAVTMLRTPCQLCGDITRRPCRIGISVRFMSPDKVHMDFATKSEEKWRLPFVCRLKCRDDQPIEREVLINL